MLHDSSTMVMGLGSMMSNSVAPIGKDGGGKSTDNQHALFVGSVTHLASGLRLLRLTVQIPALALVPTVDHPPPPQRHTLVCMIILSEQKSIGLLYSSTSTL